MITARILASRLAELLQRERFSMAEFLVELADFDRQRAWVELGHASLFDFLHRELGMAKGTAYYRKTAAELIQRFPEVLEPLRDGRLCITSIVHVSKVVTHENLAETLPKFFQRSRREAMAIAAGLQPTTAAPRRDVVTRARPEVARVDDGSVQPGEPGHSVQPGELGRSVQPGELAPSVQPGEPGCGTSLDTGIRVFADAALRSQEGRDGAASSTTSRGSARDRVIAQSSSLGTLAAARAAPPRNSADPIGADLFRLHVTVSSRFLAKLAAGRDALSHARPRISKEGVLEAALDALLERHAKRKGLVAKPRKRRPASSDARSRAGTTASLTVGTVATSPSRTATSPSPTATSPIAATASATATSNADAIAGIAVDATSTSRAGSTVASNVAPTSHASSAVADAAAFGTIAFVTAAAVPMNESATTLAATSEAAVATASEATNGSTAPTVDDILASADPSGYIPAAVRREVWIRDHGCCQWPLANGGICASTHQVQFDHKVARALGGKSVAPNLRVLCRFHNDLAARQVFGDAHMDQYTRNPRGPGGKTRS